MSEILKQQLVCHTGEDAVFLGPSTPQTTSALSEQQAFLSPKCCCPWLVVLETNAPSPRYKKPKLKNLELSCQILPCSRFHLLNKHSQFSLSFLTIIFIFQKLEDSACQMGVMKMTMGFEHVSCAFLCRMSRFCGMANVDVQPMATQCLL